MSFGIGGFGNISDMEDGFAPPATPSRIGQQASGSGFNMNVGNNTNVPNIPPPPKKLILTQKLFQPRESTIADLEDSPETTPQNQDKGKQPERRGYGIHNTENVNEPQYRQEPINQQREVPVNPMEPIYPQQAPMYPRQGGHYQGAPIIIKDTGLCYEGVQFMKFLGRYELAAETFGAGDREKAMQIIRFIKSEELKEELERMDGHKTRDWTKLRAALVDSWGELDDTILYTHQDLTNLAESWIKVGGLQNYRQYKAYLGKFTSILNYLIENEHVNKKSEASMLFLSAFSMDARKNIKRALVSKGRIPKGKDGSHKPPLWVHVIEAAETEIVVEQTEIFPISSFGQANQVMQRNFSDQRGNSQRRDRMIEEVPMGEAALKKQVADLTQDLSSLKQKLGNQPPTYGGYGQPDAQDYSRGDNPPTGQLYTGNPCYYLVAQASADPKMQEATQKLLQSRAPQGSNGFSEVPDIMKNSAQTVDWLPPGLGAENFLTNQAITRSDAQKGRRPGRIQEPEEDEMDIDLDEEIAKLAKGPPRVVPEKVRSRDKPPVKAKNAAPEEALLQELDHVKIPTTFAQLTAISPSYTEQVISKLQERLPGKSSATYIASETSKVAATMAETPDSESEKDPCYYSCTLGYVVAEIRGSKVDFMIDSGLMVNVIPNSIAQDLDLEVVKVDVPMKGVGGARCDLNGVAENCPVAIGRFSGPAHLFVSPKAQDCILGRPFLFDYGCTLKYHDSGETLSFKGSQGRHVSVPIARIGQGRGWNNMKNLGTNSIIPHRETTEDEEIQRMFRKKPVQKSIPKVRFLTHNQSTAVGNLNDQFKNCSLQIVDKVCQKTPEVVAGLKTLGSKLTSFWNLSKSQGNSATDFVIESNQVEIRSKKPPGYEDIDYLLCNGLGGSFQTRLCQSWKDGKLWCMTKYKPVGKKIRPINQPIPQTLNPPLQRPALSRDPYETPLTPNPPEFSPTDKITEERLKVINFGPEGWLLEEEIKLFIFIIILREKVLAFCTSERGLLKHSYGLPYVIPVVEHEPWQKKPIPIPAAIRDKYVGLVRDRINTGLYEQSTSSYSSPVFCVEKHDGKIRIVHDLQEMNKVTIKDAGLPPATEEFVESFAGRACYGLGDIMGGYDELPQGATNSVAVYQAQMMWILQDEIPDNVGVFIDDGGIKGPASNYQNETLERVLFRIEEAGLTISAKKFAICVPALDIVGHVVCQEGRRVSVQKKNKITTWPTPTSVTELRGFMGIVTYVRIFIQNLSEIAAPLRRLTRKDVEWSWDQDCEQAFLRLKQTIGEDITLKNLDYSKNAGAIILAVDSSFIAAGAVLAQREEETGLERPVLYESVVFSPVESRYSQPKLELCGVARIMKKLQTLLWGQHFELQVDAQSLIQMINSPSLPNAPMTRWVAFIQLFSLDIVHKPGKTFTLPDGLSRRPISEEEEEFHNEQEDFDEEEPLIKACFRTEVISQSTTLLEWEEQGFWLDLKYYLETMKQPAGMELEDFNKLKRKSAYFFIQDGQLMRRHSPTAQMVIPKIAYQKDLLKKVHEGLGHRGLEETYQRLVCRFWWPSLKKKVKLWVQSCEACQKRDPLVPREPRNSTGQSSLFGRVALDVCHIKAGQYKYLLVARDDLSGWVEAIPLVKLTAVAVGKFLLEDRIYRYGAIKTVTVDNGTEFKAEFIQAVEKTGAIFKATTPYYPEANGMIERGHRPIKDTLVKMCGESGGKWREYLPLVLFSDRISTKRTTGYSPYELVFGQKAVLPVDLEMDTYLGIDWAEVNTTAELLEARTKQLERREEILEVAHEKMMKTRSASVKFWDRKMAARLRNPLEPGELVLMYNKSLEDQWGKLFSNRWNGPFKVKNQLPKGSYILEELDGVELKRAYAASHIKRFYPRGRNLEDIQQEELMDEDREEEENDDEASNVSE
ncbi:hypothetical protein MJO28_010399 [Puccinia striiformis f. sp. tritici]|uniref:Uncharacterized protein n=1 Tax=Puccinia striiformis f. sp. tritici TaxID=168172 RepID=A0ACC0E6G9_9BASI|nr:hypothetical protein MJO28_010399 [Puccinia striiformis f. sp. tritici]